MNMKRPLLVGATIATVTLGGGGLALAATDTSSSSNDGTSLVQKIATKFKLKEADVQAVFDSDRTERRAEMKADQKERLDTAVKDDKITQAQSDYITKAQAEIETLMGDSNPRDVSSTVRDQVKTKMDALRTWANDNNVDTQYVMGGRGGHHGGFGGQHDGSDDDSSVSSGSSSAN